MRKDFQIFEEICKYLVIYAWGDVCHIWLWNRSLLNFLINEENLLLFYQCGFLQILFPRSPNLGLYPNKITVLYVLAWFYFFFRERFKRFYSPSPTETFIAKGCHCFVKEKIIGYIFFKNCNITFFSFFCFLQSLLGCWLRKLCWTGNRSR